MAQDFQKIILRTDVILPNGKDARLALIFDGTTIDIFVNGGPICSGDYVGNFADFFRKALYYFGQYESTEV